MTNEAPISSPALAGSSNPAAAVELSLSARLLTNAERCRNRYIKKREEILLRQRQEYAANPEDKKRRALTYYRNNRARVRAKQKAAYNSQLNTIRSRDYSQRNRSRVNAYHRNWRKAHPHYYNQFQAAYRARNPDKIKSLRRAAYLKDIQKSREYGLTAVAKRRALKQSSLGNHEAAKVWMVKMRRRRWVKCYYCKTQIRGCKVHFDHVTPLSKGGNHCISNLAAACQFCNNSKHVKTPQEMEVDGQRLLI